MARISDDIKLEGVQAHRKRLRLSFLLGGVDQRRDVDDGVKSLIISVVLAGVCCAGCVGYSFVHHLLATTSTTTATATVSPTDTSTVSLVVAPTTSSNASKAGGSNG
jgi:fatty acid desaturase